MTIASPSGCSDPRSSDAASRKVTRVSPEGKKTTYGVTAIPLGGYVKIPGMHRLAPADVDLWEINEAFAAVAVYAVKVEGDDVLVAV